MSATETRRKIAVQILKSGISGLSSAEIAKRSGFSLSTVRRHLAAMRDAEQVGHRGDARGYVYFLTPEGEALTKPERKPSSPARGKRGHPTPCKPRPATHGPAKHSRPEQALSGTPQPSPEAKTLPGKTLPVKAPHVAPQTVPRDGPRPEPTTARDGWPTEPRARRAELTRQVENLLSTEPAFTVGVHEIGSLLGIRRPEAQQILNTLADSPALTRKRVKRRWVYTIN